jgi:hypothetical protein
MKSKCLALLLVTVGLAAIARPLAAADTALRIVVVQTADPAAYTAEIERGAAMMAAAGSPARIRVWQARFAGDEAGTVVVSVEYPSLAALAADDALFAGNADVRAWLKGLDAIRTIVSDSIYRELTP